MLPCIIEKYPFENYCERDHAGKCDIGGLQKMLILQYTKDNS